MLGAWGITLPAAAQAPRPVVVLAGDDDTEALAERLEGQLSDLDVVVTVARASPGEPGVAARAEEATAQAAGAHEALVIWAALRTSEPRVYLLDVDAQLLFSRALGAQEMGSAAIESAAVILRTAVQAALAGRPLGLPEAEAIAAETTGEEVTPRPGPAPTTATAEPAPPEPPASEPAPDASTEEPAPGALAPLRIALGWRGEIDGASSAGAHGVWLDVALAVGPIVLGLLVEAGIPVDVPSAEVHFPLSRHAALLEVAYHVELEAELALEIGLAGGAAAYDREAATVTSGLAGTGTTWSYAALFAVLTRWVWSPGDWLSAWLAVGADAPAPRPAFAVRRAAGDTIVADLFPVSPRLELGVAIRIFP